MNNERWITTRTVWVLWIVAALALFSSNLVPIPRVAAAEKIAPDAQPAADKAADATDKDPAAEEPAQKQNFLMWIIETSGLIGAIILGLSIWFVSQVTRMFWELRPAVAIPPDIIARVEDLISKRDFKGVFELVKEDDSFFSRCLSTGIAELPNGLAEARDVMERVGESLRVDMEKKISMLAVLGTLGPMIGLLGTLKGMISSFSVIALSDTQLKASAVAKGISEALVLTFEGVALSVPAIYFFSLFRNRISSITTQAMLEADQSLRHFAHTARSKTSTAAGTVVKTPTTPKGA